MGKDQASHADKELCVKNESKKEQLRDDVISLNQGRRTIRASIKNGRGTAIKKGRRNSQTTCPC